MSTTTDEIKQALQSAHPNDFNAIQWQILFLKMTTKEREEMIFAMLQLIESRRRDSLEVYKRDPSLLAGLTVIDLREVASKVVEEAHQWILTRYPGAADLLVAFECLCSFSAGKDETISHIEFSEVLSAIRDIWTGFATEPKPITPDPAPACAEGLRRSDETRQESDGS